MDGSKVQAVHDWPTPRWQLQQFLGFANFFRCFIKRYSSIAAPLHALTSFKVQFTWSLGAEEAFQLLKNWFTTAPILTLPDADLPFVVEVDTSTTGVGAVLSQRGLLDGKLHPCAFFSHRLSPAEKNYDVGDRELLAVKVGPTRM